MPEAEYADLTHHTYPVGAHFSGFYDAHYGVDWFGPALTPELPTSKGIVQFMRSGVLLATSDGEIIVQPSGSQLRPRRRISPWRAPAAR